MIHRTKRITFRLTPEEAQDFHALIGPNHLGDWSGLIRSALRAYRDMLKPRPITTSDKEFRGMQGEPLKKLMKKLTKGNPGKRGKTAKKPRQT